MNAPGPVAAPTATVTVRFEAARAAGELEDERDEWRDEAHERKRRHILTIERALDFAEAHGLAPEDMAEYLKHGRDHHEKAHEHDRGDNLDLDLD